MKTINQFYMNIKTDIVKLMFAESTLKVVMFAVFVFCVFAIPYTAKSQSGWKWASDGNTASGNDFIGTKNWFPLIFKTNNTEQFRIAPNGYIGVGTNNPYSLLDVNGCINSKDTIFTNYLQIKAGAGLNKVLVSDGDGMAHWQSGVIGVTGATGATGAQGIQGVAGPTGATGTFDGNPVDSLTVNSYIKTDTIMLSRILPYKGDSIIRLGAHSININTNSNNISWSPVPSLWFCSPSYLIGGLTIANGNSIAGATNSMALGNNVVVGCNATNSFAVGSDVANNNPNSFLLGFGSNTLYADATGVGINTASHANELDVNGRANIRTVDPDLTNSLNQVLVRDPNNNGLLKWRDASALNSNAWSLNGNNATSASILGTTNSINLRIFAGGLQRQYIDYYTGFVGIGDGFSNPMSRLHIDEPTSTPVYVQWTNGITGNSNPNNGFKIGIDNQGNAQIIQNFFKPIQFFSNYSTYFPNSHLQEIMRITAEPLGIARDACGIYQGLRIFTGGITGGPNCNQLNLEGQLDLWVSGANSGNIRWDGSGLIRGCNNRFEIYGNLDGIYLNARNSTGQNNIPQNQYFPNIQFDITSTQDVITIPNTNQLPSPNATNVGIFAYDGDQNGIFDGFFGVNTLHPHRRVEILQGDAPQLRLTRSTGFLGGRFTDFETTQNGNLKINPYDAMVWPLNGRVGINMAAGLEPQNTLEITSGPTSPSQSGLRLTNLTTATIPIPNPGSGVLAVNGDGDVVYVDIESYLKKIETLEARLQRLEETLASLQPAQISDMQTNK